MKQFLAGFSVKSEVPGRTSHACGLIDQRSFHSVISLERKRAERSRKAFILMLLDVHRLMEEDKSTRALRAILAALSPSVRETDLRGWHENESVLGILFTDVPIETRKSIVAAMVSRVSGLLYNALTFDEFNQISISHYVFPEDWDYLVSQRPSDPKLYPDLEKHDTNSKMYAVAKRIFDVVGSVCGLVITSPIFLAIAAAIKLTSKGPVFFRQQRVGQFGTPFVFLKFRSMYVNNDSTIHRSYVTSLISGNGQQNLDRDNGNGQVVYKLTRDPRITRVGAFLRKTSLDELPQLYNVLRGEMSLVGPRPAIPYEVQAYKLWHRRRVLEAKPGISGLWQVSGRSRISFDEMVRLDVRYAMERSFWLDLKILLLTPRAVILGEGAY